MSPKNGSPCRPKTVPVKAYVRSKPSKPREHGMDPHVFKLLIEHKVERMFITAR